LFLRKAMTRKQSTLHSKELAAVFPNGRRPGANPTIVRYNTGVVKRYNSTGSLVRSEDKKNVFFCILLKKRSSLLQRLRCGFKFRIRRIGS
jgi:hypothetical protein